MHNAVKEKKKRKKNKASPPRIRFSSSVVKSADLRFFFTLNAPHPFLSLVFTAAIKQPTLDFRPNYGRNSVEADLVAKSFSAPFDRKIKKKKKRTKKKEENIYTYIYIHTERKKGMASFRSLSTFLSFFSLFRVLARSVEKSRSVFLDFGQSENERFSGGGDTCSPPVRFLNSCSNA